MIILDDLRVEMTGYRKEMTELADVLDIKAAKARIEQLGEETAKPGFWDDLENSQAVLKEQKALERKIEKYNKLNESLEDVITLIELSIEEEDDSSIEEIKSEAESFKKKLEEERLATLLTGEYDSANAILTFHAGADRLSCNWYRLIPDVLSVRRLWAYHSFVSSAAAVSVYDGSSDTQALSLHRSR